MAGAMGSEPSRRKSSSSDSEFPWHAVQVQRVLDSELLSLGRITARLEKVSSAIRYIAMLCIGCIPFI